MEFSLEQTVLAWMIAGTRVSGVIVSAPFFGSLSIPVRMKIGLALVFTMMLVPLVTPPASALSASALVVVLVGEAADRFSSGVHASVFFRSRQRCRACARHPDGIFARQRHQSAEPGGYLQCWLRFTS